ncbi:low molecular weight protein-tyrosine-phosphatase [Campylobacter sp. 19-13652]|uniref:low molecular weight protein-tyrosine-phosphatase n=1 Tax=Campylobacter sp. 19-13652 TaxID=2840180 RepID=UPI001C766A04|nr:low molecular weight protein-tyrosine-phosphatase [Campylobacter sp. 19-13652]BCX79059.1 protein-tyrosine-phosphatase [Campylobacter sp. 19-13652]
MKKIIFLCHGNICRSPVAEAVAKHEVAKAGLADKIEIHSAALSSDEIGHTPDPRSLATLKSVGLDGLVKTHRARQVQASELSDFDLFVVMDSNNVRQFRSIFGTTEKMIKLLDDKDVDDPYYTLEFDRTLNEIQAGVANLIQSLKANL